METNSIISRQTKQKNVLLEQLKKTPIVQIACEKSGVGRATYYRWRKEDEEFAKLADEALREGRELVNDMAESQLMSAIRDKNLSAILFWLKHNHPSFSTRVEIIGQKQTEYELSAEQKELLEKALQLASLIPKEPAVSTNDI